MWSLRGRLLGTDPYSSNCARRVRSQEFYERFNKLTESPLTILAFAILRPNHPLIRPVHGEVLTVLDTVDYVIWATFAIEYGIKLYLAPNR